MSNILSGISCNLDQHILHASLPLLESGQVEVLEWSFDALYNRKNIPSWFVELLKAFGHSNRLIGHGIFFSIFSGHWTNEHELWLRHLEHVTSQFNFDHITEHFGFMSGVDFHKGAPLPVPMTEETLAIAQDRLKRMANTCQRPVGIENLAFAFCIEEVKKHGDFINNMLSPINGFMILDLHNIYCQVANFNIDFQELLSYYPLDRVREIHISGGSWEPSIVTNGNLIRRDTHDNAVPAIVFTYLESALLLCPNLKYVILEQLGVGLKTENDRIQYRTDFMQMKKIVEKYNKSSNLLTNPSNETSIDQALFTPFSLNSPLESDLLHKEQFVLSEILENSRDVHKARTAISNSILKRTSWNTERWPDDMLETARLIAQKWKNGVA